MNKYKRWVIINGKGFDLKRLMEIAIKNELQITWAGKVGLCAWFEIGLCGEPSNIKKWEKILEKAKIEYHNRMPRGAWNFDHQTKDKWIKDIKQLVVHIK